MIPLVFLALTTVPIIEIGIFIAAGQAIGLFPTLAVVVLTAILGTALFRAQGMATLARAQAHLNQQQMPIEEVFTGVFLLVAGALLLTPGFLTDAMGFLLFVPYVRRTVGRWVFRKVMKQAQGTNGSRPGSGPTGPDGPKPRQGQDAPGGPGPSRQPAIDAEYELIDEEPSDTPPDADRVPETRWGPSNKPGTSGSG